MGSERNGTFLVRAWSEDQRFVARIRWSSETQAGAEHSDEEVAGNRADIHRLLDIWLDNVADDSSS